MKTKKYLLCALASAVALAAINAQDSSSPASETILAPKAVIKLSNPIHNIIWSNDRSLYAFSEGANLIIADGSTNAISEIIHASGTIRQVQVARHQNAGEEQLLILSGNNGVMKHALRKGAKSVFQNHSNASVTSIAFSDNGSYFAMGLNSGNIQVGWQLQYSGELATKNVTGHKTGPYTISFSPDNRYIASGADDGMMRVTRLEDVKLVAREPFANYVKAPVLFSADGKSVFMATDLQKIRRVAVTGATWMTDNKEYITEENVISFAEIIDGGVSKLIVLTEDQRFIWFNTETEEAEGFIPRLNKSTVADFSFSQDYSELLLGYEDGSILRINPREYYRATGTEVEVRYEDYYSNGGFGGTGGGMPGGSLNGLIPLGYPLPPDSFLDCLDISFSLLKYGILDSPQEMPYSLGGSLKTCLVHDLKNLPLYMGLMVSTAVGVPSQDYPFVYRDTAGNILSTPYLLTICGGPVIGYQVEVAQGVVVYTQLFGGASGNILWAPGIANSGIHFAGDAAIQLGVQWNGFKVYGEAQHDMTTGFSAGAGLSVRIALHEGGSR